MAWHFPQSGGTVTLADGDDVFVAAQVFINDQIYGPGSNHEVVVAGTVALYGAPVVLVGAKSAITIEATAQIRGFTANGVGAEGAESRIVNHGLIRIEDSEFTGYTAVSFYSGVNPDLTKISTFVNTGTVEADSIGVNHFNSAETLDVDNFGTISGGVSSFTSTGTSKDLITNNGKMVGKIELGAGDDLYDGRLGTIQGDVFGDIGSDRLYAGAGNDRLFGQDGNDTLMGGAGADYLSGGSGSDRASYASATKAVIVSLANPAINSGDAKGDTFVSIEHLTGSNYNDALNGNSGNNAINGGAGNDTIKGYAGDDTLTGYAGADTFVFNTALNASTNVDTITDFSFAADTIQLDNAIFTALPAGVLAAGAFRANTTGLAQDADDRIIYETDTGELYYDANGSASGGGILFAKLGIGLGLTNADFVVI
jgi:Ca2+-binding RTX toxin-like protein